MGKIGVQTARDRVKEYCASHKITQKAFADMINITHTTMGRFMAAGRETTGKGSMAYDAINRFFAKEGRERLKEQKSQMIAAENELFERLKKRAKVRTYSKFLLKIHFNNHTYIIQFLLK